MSVERVTTAMPYAPPRGTRPGNRKELIRRAGAELFYEYGFASVSMSQIARAVSIGPSALYRHFTGKHELLIAVVDASIEEVKDALRLAREGSTADQPASWDDAFISMALDTRSAGVLWQREARHLPEPEQAKLAAAIREIRRELRDSIQLNHPEIERWEGLFTSAVLSVCLSLSYHHVSLPRPEFELLMKQMVSGVLNVELGLAAAGVPGASPVIAKQPAGTQEKLVAAASELFARKGFGQTGVEEIADAVGISEPSIYHHFPSKLDLLFEVLQHGNDALQKGRAAVLSVPDSPENSLRRLLVSYLDTVAADSDLITLLVTELGNLDEEKQAVAVAQQRAYLNQWVDLLLRVRPKLPRDAARIRVHAVLTVINDYIARRHGELAAEERAVLILICSGLLGL